MATDTFPTELSRISVDRIRTPYSRTSRHAGDRLSHVGLGEREVER
jgi:hypothetical protein